MTQRNAIRVSFAIALAVGSVQHAQAQEKSNDASRITLEEIIVTAQKRAESLQDVPIAITVTTQEQIQRDQIYSLSDLQRTTPALEINQTFGGETGGGRIRGIGTNVFNQTAEGSVAIVVDGVPSGNVPNPQIFDVAQIEVLRGPQGTLFGQTASAGVIGILRCVLRRIAARCCHRSIDSATCERLRSDLLTMTAGCVLFMPASAIRRLHCISCSRCLCSRLASRLFKWSRIHRSRVLGAPATAHSRLTFAQAFNSLGTTVFPYVGSILILGSLATIDQSTLSGAALDAYRAAETRVVFRTYLGLAIALTFVAVMVWMWRNSLVDTHTESSSTVARVRSARPATLWIGRVVIFLYVGAEVAIGSVIVNYLMQSNVMGLAAEDAGKNVPLVLGRRDGRAFRRRLFVARVLAGQTTRLCCSTSLLQTAGSSRR